MTLLALALALTFARFPVTLDDDPDMFIRVNNAEATREHRNLLVHAFLKPRPNKKVTAVEWQNLFSLVNAAGEELRPSGDCGVDTGTGMHITMGNFPLAERGETRIMVYFNLGPADFPVRLKLRDERLSPPIR